MDEKNLTAEEIDTIGEIMNISMGAAATAVSTMLERQVSITTPSIEQIKLHNIDCSALEPAIIVVISYVEGVSGTSVIILRRNDMRIILDLLMGNDFTETDDSFEFDDMSMSAACEVMNQMMGASATALSEVLGRTVNISTPTATLVEDDSQVAEALRQNGKTDDDILNISFKMSIKETLDTNFSSIMPLDFVRELVQALSADMEKTVEPEAVAAPAPQPAPQPAPAPSAPYAEMARPPEPVPAPAPVPRPAPAPQPVPQPAPAPQPVPQPQPQPAPIPQPAAPQYQQPYPQPPMQEPYPYNMPLQGQPPAAAPYPQPPYPQQPYMQPPYGNEFYPPQYGAYQEPHPNLRYASPVVNVKQADFPEFAGAGSSGAPAYPNNMGMLMGVNLEVSVIVGRAKQKIKDVLDFGQGSVIELDKQTGSPAEIMVNGQLLAYGDVVVVGDNFGVRITEIVGTKDLLDSLDTKK